MLRWPLPQGKWVETRHGEIDPIAGMQITQNLALLQRAFLDSTRIILSQKNDNIKGMLKSCHQSPATKAFSSTKVLDADSQSILKAANLMAITDKDKLPEKAPDTAGDARPVGLLLGMRELSITVAKSSSPYQKQNYPLWHTRRAK